MTQSKQEFRALGKDVRTPSKLLDPIDLPASVQQVTYTSDEVTAMCPVTGQPDMYVVSITVYGAEPSNTGDTRPLEGIESKSLKLYLQSYRDEGIFAESLADAIAADVVRQISCGSVSVETVQKARGGISIRTVARLDGSPR
jgi:7-cyano-7-deazaguanine reductase